MDEKTKARAAKLFDLGLKYDGTTFLYYDINFHWTDVLCMTDEKFDKAFEGATKRKAVIDSELCPDCLGDGDFPSDVIVGGRDKCKSCNGSGKKL